MASYMAVKTAYESACLTEMKSEIAPYFRTGARVYNHDNLTLTAAVSDRIDMSDVLSGSDVQPGHGLALED